MRIVRGILIDPVAHTCTEVEHDADNYKDIYKLLSDEKHGLKVECFTCVSIDTGDTIYVDDEGLLKDPEFFFVWRDYPQPLAGRALILGSDDEGETQSAKITLDEVRRRKVSFTRLSVKGFHTTQGDTTLHGQPAWGISTVPIFGKPEKESD